MNCLFASCFCFGFNRASDITFVACVTFESRVFFANELHLICTCALSMRCVDVLDQRDEIVIIKTIIDKVF